MYTHQIKTAPKSTPGMMYFSKQALCVEDSSPNILCIEDNIREQGMIRKFMSFIGNYIMQSPNIFSNWFNTNSGLSVTLNPNQKIISSDFFENCHRDNFRDINPHNNFEYGGSPHVLDENCFSVMTLKKDSLKTYMEKKNMNIIEGTNKNRFQLCCELYKMPEKNLISIQVAEKLVVEKTIEAKADPKSIISNESDIELVLSPSEEQTKDVGKLKASRPSYLVRKRSCKNSIFNRRSYSSRSYFCWKPITSEEYCLDNGISSDLEWYATDEEDLDNEGLNNKNKIEHKALKQIKRGKLKQLKRILDKPLRKPTFRPRSYSESSVDSDDSFCIVFEETENIEISLDYESGKQNKHHKPRTSCVPEHVATKIRFSTTNISYEVPATCESRKGPWFQMACDRIRDWTSISFKIEPILDPEHRMNIYHQRFKNFDY